ncbi:hypothetical protein IWW50_003059 [Coemansia erecta]|nr:hypothetical protein IWW50_003059 [Coemansia erecta]
MAVKNAQKVFKDKLVAAEARYHFAKERCDTNKLLKEINSEIGSSLDSGGVNAEQG